MATSKTLKAEALAWLRFGKQLPYIATEAGRWNADVLGANTKMSVEIEVKISKSDLQREFRSKKAKHYLYANADGQQTRNVPNYFYFYVPEEMEEYALGIVNTECPKAGLAIYSHTGLGNGNNTRVAKRPTKLHDQAPLPVFLRTVLKRMGSELVSRYVASRIMHEEVVSRLEDVDKKVVEAVKAYIATPDHEENDSDKKTDSKD